MRHQQHTTLPPFEMSHLSIIVRGISTERRVRDALAGTGADSGAVHIGELRPA